MPFNRQHKRLQDLMSEMWNGDNFVDTNQFLQLFSAMFENDREINEEDDAPYAIDQIIKFVNNNEIRKLFELILRPQHRKRHVLIVGCVVNL